MALHKGVERMDERDPENKKFSGVIFNMPLHAYMHQGKQRAGYHSSYNRNYVYSA